MEILAEILGELFLEVFAGAAYQPKMPKWLRVLILVIVWYGIAAAFLYDVFAHTVPEGERGATIALSIIAGVFIIFGTVGIIRVFTRKPQKEKLPLDNSDE